MPLRPKSTGLAIDVMTLEVLRQTVLDAGSCAGASAGNPYIACQWMQIKMLAEIAAQLAEMNERQRTRAIGFK